MNPIYTELCSIFLLLFVLTDYYIKISKKIKFSSKIFSLECISILFLTIINILFYIFDKTYLILTFYIFMIVPIIIHAIIIDRINISKEKDILSIRYSLIYFIGYSFIIVYCYLIGVLNSSLNNLNEFRYLICILNFIPLIYVSIKLLVYRLITEKRIIYMLILPLVGGIACIIFKKADFLTFIYSISNLFIYIYMHDIIINKDSLTGANNRRYLDSYVYSNDRKYAVYMIDVDDFKKINDTYGHEKGDNVLKDLVELLKLSVRTTDSVIRTGGDEFVIIAAMKNDNDIKIIYNRIKDNINKYNKKNKIKINLSIGYDLYSSHLDFSVFLDKIDKEMYKNKKAKKKKYEKENN